MSLLTTQRPSFTESFYFPQQWSVIRMAKVISVWFQTMCERFGGEKERTNTEQLRAEDSDVDGSGWEQLKLVLKPVWPIIKLWALQSWPEMRSWWLILTGKQNTDWWWWLDNSPKHYWGLHCRGGVNHLESEMTHCYLSPEKQVIPSSVIWVTSPCWWKVSQASVPSIRTPFCLGSRSYRWLQEALSSRWTNRMTWLRKERKEGQGKPKSNKRTNHGITARR